VAVIDRRSEAFTRLGPGFSGTTVAGIGFDRDTLKEAGIEGAGAVAAVTNGDNSNILIARVAREAFGVERVAARIYDPKRAVIYERLGIPTIATVQWTIDRVVRRLVPDDAAPAWVDPTAAIALIERTVPGHWAGKPISALEDGTKSRVVSIARNGVSTVADRSQPFQDGDVAWVAVPTELVDAFDESFHLVSTGGHH